MAGRLPVLLLSPFYFILSGSINLEPFRHDDRRHCDRDSDGWGSILAMLFQSA